MTVGDHVLTAGHASSMAKVRWNGGAHPIVSTHSFIDELVLDGHAIHVTGHPNQRFPFMTAT
jgi:hypothetical protein